MGIDLSSQDERTAACLIRWGEHDAEITDLVLGVSDEQLVGLSAGCSKVGIDVPFGWPRPFAEAIWSHAEGHGWPTTYRHSSQRDEMRFRATDLWIRDHCGQQPLSVSSDRIALPAMRAAWLLTQLGGRPVELSGRATVVEVYPALALRQWGLHRRNYKRKEGTEIRRQILSALASRAGAIEMGRWRLDLEAPDDRLDAFIAAIVARCTQRPGLCTEIPADHEMDARREGWIAVPTKTSLDELF